MTRVEHGADSRGCFSATESPPEAGLSAALFGGCAFDADSAADVERSAPSFVSLRLLRRFLRVNRLFSSRAAGLRANYEQ